MLSAAKHLAADRDRPFASRRRDSVDCSPCQGLCFTIEPCLNIITYYVTIQQGVPMGLQGPLAGYGVSPPPQAAQEQGKLNSYLITIFFRPGDVFGEIQC